MPVPPQSRGCRAAATLGDDYPGGLSRPTAGQVAPPGQPVPRALPRHETQAPWDGRSGRPHFSPTGERSRWPGGTTWVDPPGAVGESTMPPSPLDTVLHAVRRMTDPRQGQEQTDGQLLRRFIAEKDEAAFAELMRR